MATLPAFRDARQWLLGSLDVQSGGSILEAGCGNAASHADLHAMVGPRGRIVGIDPTKAFIETPEAEASNRGPHTRLMKPETSARCPVRTRNLMLCFATRY
jgi:ubiquinone/menaquinone biosynthesis C-methylase UbiE